MTEVVGVVLAAGAGTRYGGPKALARTTSGEPWVERAVAVLRAVGCSSVVVALGAGVGAAVTLIPAGVRVLAVPEWAEGLSATLRSALTALDRGDADAAMIVPVDTPDMPAEVCERLLAPASDRVLARAVYRGVPGHPVLLGRSHWRPVADSVRGDEGAGAYLRAHDAMRIECGDLWDGADIDRTAHTGGSGADDDVLGLLAGEQVADLATHEGGDPRVHRARCPTDVR